MFNFFTAEQVGGIVRLLLGSVAAGAITKGYVDQNTATQLVGAVVTLGMFGWSWVSHSPSALIASVNSSSVPGVKVVAQTAQASQVDNPILPSK